MMPNTLEQTEIAEIPSGHGERETVTPSTRYHSLDALRAFALLLGIVFHAAESFGGNQGWAISDRHYSLFLNRFQYVSHSFRLEIFFLMAGFFARLVYHKRGLRSFAYQRIQRILIPLIVGWIALAPPMVYLWVWGAQLSGNYQVLGLPPEVADIPTWQVTIAFFTRGMFLQRFDTMHLWFLHQLVVVYVLAFALRSLFVRVVDRSGAWRARIDSGFERLMRSPWKLLPLAFVTTFMLFIMNSWGVDTPRHVVFGAHIPTTVLYGFLFTLGWFFHRSPELLEVAFRNWWLYLISGILILIPLFNFNALGEWLGATSWPQPVNKLIHCFFYAIMMWSWVLAVSGFFIRYCTGGSPAWRYVADSSYWLYLVHLPIVVFLQIQLASTGLHWVVKYVAINMVSLPILLLSYHYLARSTFIGKQLNGRRYPFRPFFTKQLPVTPQPPDSPA